MGGRIRRLWTSAAHALSPSLRIVLVLALILHGVGIGWGLPASDGWDNDGIAPRDVLPGLADTFTPGRYFTYPPAHLILLALLTSPATAIAIARAGPRVPDVVREILAPSYMTAFALTARIVAVLMSLGIAIAIARITEEILPELDDAGRRRAGTFAAAVASAGVSFTYYAHTTNLDVPSLFWGSLAALSLVRAIARREPRRLRRFAILAALAVATKDQTYALFVLPLPIVLLPWAARDRVARREILIALLIGAVAIAVLDGALVNPSGFAARIAFLRGPASQDHSNYAADAEGRVRVVLQIAREIGRHYPPPFAALIGWGLGISLVARGRRAAASVPALIAISFTLAFNVAARRTDDRFALPQMLILAVYAGIALEELWSWRSVIVRLGVVLLLALEVREALRVDYMFVAEPRYATERFLRERVVDGDTIEVHGLNAYLPRFPGRGRVVRVGPGPAARRSPLPGVEEVEGSFMAIEARRPRFVVVSTCFAWRYFANDVARHEGRIYPTGQARLAVDPDGTTFFQGLFAGTLPYRIVHDSKIPPNRILPPIEIHASLNCRATTFERVTR